MRASLQPAHSDKLARSSPLESHTCTAESAGKCDGAHSGATPDTGSHPSDAGTIESIECAVRERKEAFFEALQGAHAVDGARRAKVVGATAPPL